MVVTASSDGSARLCDAGAAPHSRSIFRHAARVSGVAFSPDGKTIVTGSYDRTVTQWNAETGRAIGVPMRHREPVLSLAISPNGKTIATGCGPRAGSTSCGLRSSGTQ